MHLNFGNEFRIDSCALYKLQQMLFFFSIPKRSTLFMNQPPNYMKNCP